MSLFGGEINHFGLDIGESSIRVVQLSGSAVHTNLVAFGSVDIPAGLAKSDSQIDQQQLAKIISELVKKAQISTKRVVSAIPGTSVFNVVVNFPAMSKGELEKAVQYQAEQSLPVKIEDVKYDWQVIKQNPSTKEVSVMIIAATKSKVEQMVKLLHLAELDVVALETATVAMARSLSVPQDPLVMVLDIGATTTEIGILENGVLVQTRSFPLAGFAITRAISQALGLDTDQAETFKQKFGLSRDKLEGQVFKASEPILHNILEEATRSTKFYQEQFGRSVDRVVLTGGSSLLPLLPEYIKSIMGVEVVIGNPWSKISFQPTFSDKLNSIAPHFSTAVGLAMRD